MSLTRFLKNKDVRERFRQEFPRPEFKLKMEMLAPPVTRRYLLVGTAFDYLMRFYLKRLNPDAVTGRWVAESWPVGLAITIPGVQPCYVDGEGWCIIQPPETLPENAKRLVGICQQIVEQAKMVYSSYLASGAMTDEVMRSALLLAQLDPIVRSGYVDENLGTIDDGDVTDLRNLVSIVNRELFKAKKLCMLNPTFGEASRLVGGADADLLIDDALIEIKTTKTLKLDRNYLNQLIGYYILFKIGGIDDVPSEPKIERLGIYYSRYGELYTFPVRAVVDEDRLPSFTEWFKERAENRLSVR